MRDTPTPFSPVTSKRVVEDALGMLDDFANHGV